MKIRKAFFAMTLDASKVYCHEGVKGLSEDLGISTRWLSRKLKDEDSKFILKIRTEYWHIMQIKVFSKRNVNNAPQNLTHIKKGSGGTLPKKQRAVPAKEIKNWS